VGRASVVSGTETDAFKRIERLERELVELRGTFAGERAGAGGPLLATAAYVAHPLPGIPAQTKIAAPAAALATELPRTRVTPNGAAVPGDPAVAKLADPGAAQLMRGRATVIPKPSGGPDPTSVTTSGPPPRPPRTPVSEQVRLLKRGGGWSWFGAIVAFLCWSVWAISNFGHGLVGQALGFVLVLIVAGGLFALLRLVGRIVLVRWLGRERRTARLSHLGVAAFLLAVGYAYLRLVPWLNGLIG
jgi:hypothetical protein